MKDQIEKQAIEEMARILCEACASDPSPCHLVGEGKMCEGVLKSAEVSYNAGYHKQAWISVEERLPEKRKHVLCYYPEKDYGSKVVVDYAETDDGYFSEQFQYGKPSHWMPLPPPPKMKGGAE